MKINCSFFKEKKKERENEFYFNKGTAIHGEENKIKF